MKNTKLISIVLAVILIGVVAAYFFWPVPAMPIKKHKKPSTSQSTSTTATTSSTTTLSVSTSSTGNLITLSMSSDGTPIKFETPYEFHQYTNDSGAPTLAKVTGFRGIGEKDMFALLIPPPPPPPPIKQDIKWITRNWKLWEVVDENQCVIADARPMDHTLRLGEQMEGVVIKKIEPAENRVMLAMATDSKDTRYLVLDSIDQIMNGWKLKGTVPALKIAFVVTGDNRTNKVKQGDVLAHTVIKEVMQGKVMFSYGTMTKELKQ